jgi:L-threonylcarbamoyladenylate synthase
MAAPLMMAPWSYSGSAMVQTTRIMPLDDEAIAEATLLLLAGEPVAVPTETVYGLAADATNADAVARIYAAKGRPSFNPLIVHVPNLEAAERIGSFDRQARELALHYWPGPLTLVVPLRENGGAQLVRGTGEQRHGIASIVTAGLPTIALRVPAHAAMQALLKSCDRPLAAPSANASGQISPTRASHVLASLGGRIPLVIDGGATQRGIESTIVAATDGSLRLLRRGPIDIAGAKQLTSKAIEAPGQLASHYAPNKPVRLDATEAEAGEFLIGFGLVKGAVTLSKRGDPVEAAAHLFDLLHQADAAPYERIAIAPIPGDGIAAAIRDRLKRAAAPRS